MRSLFCLLLPCFLILCISLRIPWVRLEIRVRKTRSYRWLSWFSTFDTLSVGANATKPGTTPYDIPFMRISWTWWSSHRIFANRPRSRSGSIAATMGQARSGVKIAAQRDPPPRDQLQSGLAHAVQFTYALFAKDAEIPICLFFGERKDLIAARDFDMFDALIIFQEHFIRETGRRAQGQIAFFHLLSLVL